MDSIDNNSKTILVQYIERIERLEKEKSEISDDIKNILTEAKGYGFVPSIIKQVIKARKMDIDQLNEKEALFELYKNAVGLE